MKNNNTILTLHNCSLTSQDKDMLFVDQLAHYVQAHRDMVFPHKHNFYHFVFFSKGSGNHLIDFEQYAIQANQIYFMTPGQVHTWNFEGDEAGYIVNFDQEYFQSFLLRADYIRQLTFFTGNKEDMLFQIPEEYQKKILEGFHTLYETYQQPNTKDLTRVCLLHLLLYIASFQERKMEKAVQPYHRTIFQNYQVLVEQHYKFKRLPKYYADALCITVNHLNAICKANIDRSAGDIIRKRVVLEAKRLLINKTLNIKEIANELQFKDNSYFSKFFKRAAAMSPEEFRKIL